MTPNGKCFWCGKPLPTSLYRRADDGTLLQVGLFFCWGPSECKWEALAYLLVQGGHDTDKSGLNKDG